MDELVNAICHEISLKNADWPQRKVKTIYFGGGTPSVLSENHLLEIFTAIKKNYDLSALEECTLEANPEDITKEIIGIWDSLGIDRISLGVQSWNDDLLKKINRNHNSTDTERSLELLAGSNINKLSLDLIYGIPGQDEKDIYTFFKKLETYKVGHFSAYALTKEDKTLLDVQVKRGLITMPEEEQYWDLFKTVLSASKKHGYDQYEISNYCLSGQEAVHNTGYWFGMPYLGFGPGAHSFNGYIRRWNIASIHKYKAAIKNQSIFHEQETLTKQDRYNELILTRLRTKWGIVPSIIQEKFPDFDKHFTHKVKEFEDKGLVNVFSDRITLNPDGLFLCDYISSEMMVDNE